ncbi:calponin homology domain-containing protein DDB_G0272472 isoform X2 [Strongylocentrotus purpuratus]|uniref:Uncharacterized protein n=1 Tax=Strongylocentrotus purpuratus TaxID=7668 RepID=A0A7M7PSL3_STRPU|nr:calponin homology domain-containing protein DDB_G0272472 isoform X2 [Strongylocentrotus purpuratus]
MGNPTETAVNDQRIDNSFAGPVSSQGIKYDTDNAPRTTQAGDDAEQIDSGHDRNNGQHRKKKRHRHRHHSHTEVATNSDHGATSGGHDGDNETGEDSSENCENIVVSSSIKKKRSRGSSRHHKHSSKDVVSGEDSGLSLGNSLNESTVAGDISLVTPNEHDTENGSEVITQIAECHNDIRTQNAGDVPEEESRSDPMKQAVDNDDKEEVMEVLIPNSNNGDQANTNSNVPTNKEGHVTHHGHLTNSNEQKDTSESKKTDRMHRRLERQKSQYRIEKEMLKKRLDGTRTKFQEEITKYEQDLSNHRKEYLEQLSSLQFQEQYESLSLRINDLGQLEEDLDKRFKDCIEQQTDELDSWQSELDIKRRQLETADTSRRRTDSSLNTSYSKATTDEEDYILKKNLLKCQADLARSEEENAILHKQVYSLKKQYDSAQIQTHNHEKKIKQLENQLVIALSQLGSPKQNHLNENSLPPINGHRHSVASSSTDSRIEEIQRETRLRRQLGKDHLSINQEAALRRKLSGKDSGISTRSPSTSRISKITLKSVKDVGLNEESGGRSHTPGSVGGSQSGEEGCQHPSLATSDVGTSPGKSQAQVSPKTEKSSVCAVM